MIALTKCSSDDKYLYLTLTGQVTRDGTVFLSVSITIYLWKVTTTKQMYILSKATLPFGSVNLSPKAYTANQLVMFNPINTSSPSLASWYLYTERGSYQQSTAPLCFYIKKRNCLLDFPVSSFYFENQVPDPSEVEDCRGRELIIPDFIMTLPMNVKRTTFWQEKKCLHVGNDKIL